MKLPTARLVGFAAPTAACGPGPMGRPDVGNSDLDTSRDFVITISASGGA
jgi:hypothetical protein